MKRDSTNLLRTVACGLAGLLIGAVLGFAVVFGVVMMLPRGNFGEMQGVAAIDAGLLAGAPLGALLCCGLGVWRGMKTRADKVKDRR